MGVKEVELRNASQIDEFDEKEREMRVSEFANEQLVVNIVLK